MSARLIQLIQGDMDAAEIPDNTADLVLAMGSLQYARDPAPCLRRFAGWLRLVRNVCVSVDSLVALILELRRDQRDQKRCKPPRRASAASAT